MLVFTVSAQERHRVYNSRAGLLADSLDDFLYSDSLQLNYLSREEMEEGGKVSRLVYRSLFRKGTPVPDKEDLEVDTTFNAYAGMRIDSIVIVRLNVFDQGEEGATIKWFHRVGNAIHTVTKEGKIRKDLLFRTGDRLDPALMVRNEALLRDNDYLSDVVFRVEKNPDGGVTVYLYTRDSGSLSVDGSYRKDLNSNISIADNNFLGYGNRLRLIEYFNRSQKRYFSATELQYDIRNLWGSFIDFKTALGYGRDFYVLEAGLGKEFIRLRDYAFGAEFSRKKDLEGLIDTTEYIDRERQNLWAGKAFVISPYNDQFFVTVRGERVKFYKRPEVARDFNPYFHDRINLLTGLGFYKERFYKSNLIYGYGYTENIPYGYKAEVVGGYSFQEFGRDMPYFGVNLSIGNRVKLGYLGFSLKYGTHIQGHGKGLDRQVFDGRIYYFSNLWRFPHNVYVRQFVNFGYTTGSHLMQGDRNSIVFNNKYYLNSASGGVRGTTRFNYNPQTIIFTPLHIYGFRFAFFTFLDVGTIGESPNPFRNSFYGMAGAGVRIKNERLIFDAIQISLTVPLRYRENFVNQFYRMSMEPKLKIPRYIPEQPEIIDFD